MIHLLHRTYDRVCPILKPPARGAATLLLGIAAITLTVAPYNLPLIRLIDIRNISIIGAVGGTVCSAINHLAKKHIFSPLDPDTKEVVQDVYHSIHPVIRSFAQGATEVTTGIITLLATTESWTDCSRVLPEALAISAMLGGLGGATYYSIDRFLRTIIPQPDPHKRPAQTHPHSV